MKASVMLACGAVSTSICQLTSLASFHSQTLLKGNIPYRKHLFSNLIRLQNVHRELKVFPSLSDRLSFPSIWRINGEEVLSEVSRSFCCRALANKRKEEVSAVPALKAIFSFFSFFFRCRYLNQLLILSHWCLQKQRVPGLKIQDS